MAKGTEAFNTTIENYLKGVAAKDEAFAVKFANPEKSIEKCCNYIFATVQKSGCNGFEDAEVYGMAMHYYDEEKIEVGKLPANMKVVVNHHVELTEADKEEARNKALDNLVKQEEQRLQAKKKKPSQHAPKPAKVDAAAKPTQPVKPVVQQASLF